LQGKYTEAEPLYARYIDIKQKTDGADHHGVAISLVNQADLYRLQ
ncbi:unnamed protein product, partial [Scytosiphon promiscuus]